MDLLCLWKVALCKCSSTDRPLGAYNLGVATPRALVYAGVMTSGDARLCAGRATAAPRGGKTGARTGREGGRTRGRFGDQDNGDVRNVIENNYRRGCTYKDFLACNPKEYDSKGGAIVYTRWIKKMESVQDMCWCRDNQKVKYTVRSFGGKALT
ncbi:hypothetical protein Tco_0804416 [Tanacetum coccineum]|uniref:Reverse transcriptase domain-containing protein n=1 Tax=Tanacetum coccineum TaxID=301880 RepID=A0ABQ5A8L6_9ASTR